MNEICGVPETMLQTLYARAKETKKEHPIIRDEKAVEMAATLSYDFSKADKDAVMSSGVIARTLLLDRMTEDWLGAHPGAVVVNIACGLDTRCYRTNQTDFRWYNLDLPETMAVRRRFLKETDNIRQIAASAMAEDWIEQVEQTDEPVLVIIEGLTMYLDEASVRQIFDILSRRFAHARVLVEVMNPWIVKHVKEKSIEGSHAKFTWGVKGGAQMQALIPAFRVLEEVSLVEGMKVFLPIYHVLGKIGFVRNISNKILVLEK